MGKNSISDIMQSNVITVNVNDSIEEVEKLISDKYKSFLPVLDDDNGCFGIISQSDILRFHQEKRNSKLEHAWEVCSHSTINVDSDISINEATNLMIEKNIHHFVVSKDLKVEGVVSSIDLLRFYLEQSK